MNLLEIRQGLLVFLIIILIFASFALENISLSILFGVFAFVTSNSMVRSKNYNKTRYLSFTAICLFLFTIIYSNLFWSNGLTSFTTYVPFIVGILVAILLVPELEFKKLNQEIILLKRRKNISEALDKADKMLKMVPKSYVARYNRATILIEMERFEEALDEADELLEGDGDDLLAQIIESVSLFGIGNKDEAFEIVDGILEKTPKNEVVMASALSTKAEMLFEMENYPESISYFDDALAKIPQKKVRFRKGLQLMHLCTLDNYLTELWIKKGKAHQKLQQYNVALECFEKALKLDPDSEDAINAKVELLNKLKD